MIDWTYLDTALQVSPTLLNPDKLLIAQGQIARGEGIIIGIDHKLAIQVLFLAYLFLVDKKTTSRILSQILSISLTGEKCPTSINFIMISRVFPI